MFVGAAMTSADGRCKTLDSAADGYVRSEAFAALKLRFVLNLILGLVTSVNCVADSYYFRFITEILKSTLIWPCWRFVQTH